jgi:tetratricopeptide (TPR) repeat protein
MKTKVIYIASAISLLLIYGFFCAVVITRTNHWRITKAREYLSEAKKIDSNADKLLLLEKAAVLDPNEETYLKAGITALELGDNTLAEKYLGRVKTAEGYFQLANAYYNLEKYDLSASTYEKVIDTTKTAASYAGLGKSHLKLGNIDQSLSALQSAYEIEGTTEIKNLIDLLTISSVETDPANRAVVVYNSLLRLGYPQSAEKILLTANEMGYQSRDSLITLADRAVKGDNNQLAIEYLLKAITIDPYYPQIYQQLEAIYDKLGMQEEAEKYREFGQRLLF